jgi:hypothetical protein
MGMVNYVRPQVVGDSWVLQSRSILPQLPGVIEPNDFVMPAPTRVPGTIKALKGEALALLDEMEAIEILINAITPERLQRYRETGKRSNTIPRVRETCENY